MKKNLWLLGAFFCDTKKKQEIYEQGFLVEQEDVEKLEEGDSLKKTKEKLHLNQDRIFEEKIGNKTFILVSGNLIDLKNLEKKQIFSLKLVLKNDVLESWQWMKKENEKPENPDLQNRQKYLQFEEAEWTKKNVLPYSKIKQNTFKNKVFGLFYKGYKKYNFFVSSCGKKVAKLVKKVLKKKSLKKEFCKIDKTS